MLPRLFALLLAFAFAAAATPAAEIAHWRFESSPGLLADSGPHALTLSAVDTAPAALTLPASGAGAAFSGARADGLANLRAASLGGSGNFSRAHHPALAPGSAFTIELLARRAAAGTASAYLAGRWTFTGANARSWALGVAGTTPPSGLLARELFLVLSADGSAVRIVGSGLVVPDAADLYLAAAFEPGEARFFLRNLSADGPLATTTVAHDLTSLHLGDASFTLGAYDTNRNRWSGLIDEVRLSDTALAAGSLLVAGEAAPPPPLLSPVPGIYVGSLNVELSAAPGAALRYTLDGSAPGPGSALYTAPFSLENSATVRAVSVSPDGTLSAPVEAAYQVLPYPLLGLVRPRAAAEIRASDWSVGGETLDRGYAVYAHYRERLGRLGAKHVRLQAGWARTESTPGVYDWAWLDEAVFDSAARGLAPWINVSYGNPAYSGGGGSGLGAAVPSSATARAAWDAWLDAMVRRYASVVSTWEIWNEPADYVSVTDYTELFLRSARIIRARQPSARIVALALATVDTTYARAFLENLQAAGELGLVDEISYHAYNYVPEAPYSQVSSLRNLVAGHDPRIRLRQGENGAPSRRGGFGALNDHDWTERTQAKWNLRRLMGDRGRGIPSSLFSIADMQYPTGNNDKGLLLTDPVSQLVLRPKETYHAASFVFSLFDERLRVASAWSVTHDGGSSFVVFPHEHAADGRRLFVAWAGGQRPEHERPFTLRRFTLPDAGFAEPVWVDLRTGLVRAVPASQISRGGGLLTLSDIPAYDSPILVAERSLVLRPYDEWVLDQLGPAAYADPDRSSPLAPGADGRANLERYAFASEAGGRAPTLETTPDGRIRLRFRAPRADLLAQVEHSTDLLTWTPAATTSEPGGDEVWTAPDASPRRFARVRLELR